MAYKDLYKHCQQFTPKISRKHITPKVLELTGTDKIRTAYTNEFDVEICRGFFLDGDSHKYGSGKFIVIHRDLTYCWKRMVFVKELMHCFDTEDEMVNSAESLGTLLNDLVIPALEEVTPQIQSENNAIFMALGVLCSEEHRKKYKKERDAGRIDDYSIAVELRIPELYVPLLLHPIYEDRIKKIIE